MSNTDSNHEELRLINVAKDAMFWIIVLLSLLWFTTPNAKAADEEIVAAVISSTPYYGKRQTYSKHCVEGTTRCFLIGDTPQYYATTFTNGRVQFTVLTVAQFPIDVWFDVVRNCDDGKCVYRSAIMSQYQSPESLAIDEIQKREQVRYLLDPKRMY